MSESRVTPKRGCDKRQRDKFLRPAVLSTGQEGSITAELVVVMPVLVVLLVACMGAIHAVTLQVRLSSAAATSARALARGDPIDTVRTLVQRVAVSAVLAVERRGDLVCSRVSAPLGNAFLTSITIQAGNCVLDDGDAYE